ncbi:1-phosphofructokinase family hexose kinase [Gillisia sp. M10.2A]|uniref:1-phosphofructokinase family hexose kinase n=1 Tax=Gillisia lutea TaxID=2909668 RepID=A0ABS9EE26_9FLAO|nr:1-phosphofructokinase family hexose kinase [Gillisia lutea]MCF4101134.1 1-phosphofructokinase family hexose kinase [Gillisia lutea]
MKRVLTLTLNPAIDKSTEVAGIKPNSKLRCAVPVYEAGGGGINVSRVINNLGGSSLAVFLAGGSSGVHLISLLKKEGITQRVIPIKEWVRENLAVMDTSNNLQYRFGMPGATVSEKERQEVLKQLEILLPEVDFLVASGSLPPGIPEEFFTTIASLTKKNKVKLILDTSGRALIRGAETGVFLLKPNLEELCTLAGVESVAGLEVEELAKQLINKGVSEVIVVSMGARGAVLVSAKEVEYIAAPTVHQKSTIGAGDSMVAGMVYSLALGKSYSEMAKYGVACGTAATISPGTQLCTREDANRLYNWITANKTINRKS